MLPHAATTLVGLLPLLEAVNMVLVDGHHPYRSFRAFKIQRRLDDVPTRAGLHDSAQDVIYAPLDGEPVITKGIYFVNGISEKDDQIYEAMLRKGVESPDKLDRFFVTTPPERTTVSVKDNIDDSQQANRPEQDYELQKIIGRSGAASLTVEEKAAVRYRAPLRLVTIPPKPTTPLPPFKHLLPITHTAQPQVTSTTRSGYVVSEHNTPVNPWQIPTLPTLPFPQQGLLNPLQNPLLPSSASSTPNPFLAAPNPFIPITPLKDLNITYPFVPIGTSNPAQQPFLFPPPNPLLIPPQQNQKATHQSSFRRGSPLHTGVVEPIPIATVAGLASGDAYVDSTRLQYTKKASSELDYSIDARATEVKQDRLSSAKSFGAPRQIRTSETEGTRHVDQTRYLWCVYRNAPRNLLRRRKYRTWPCGVYKSEEVVSHAADRCLLDSSSVSRQTLCRDCARRGGICPQQGSLPRKQTIHLPLMSYSPDVETPPASRARSALSPNEKLNLCCLKKAVSPSCQSMCNFDVLNEKTIVSGFMTNVCPGPQLSHAFECASSKVDHSICCERAGIHGYHGGRCMQFCRAHQDQPSNVLEFIPCLQVFEHIKSCYVQHQATNKNILGD